MPTKNRKGFSLISVAVIVAAFAVVIFSFVQSWVSIQNSFSQLNTTNVPIIERVSAITLHISRARIELYRYIQHYEPTPFRIHKYLNEVETNLLWVSRKQLPGNSKELAKNLLVDTDRFHRTLDQLQVHFDKGDSMHVAFTANTLVGYAATLSSLSGKLQDSITEYIRFENNKLKKLLLQNYAILAGISFVIVLMLVGGLLLFSRSLQKKVQASTAELQNSMNELRKSEARYRSIAEDTPILICRFLPEGEITYVNSMYCEYFEKTPEELVGSSFLQLIPESDRESVMAGLTALTPEMLTQSHEHRVIKSGGEIGWQRWTSRALFDDQGRLYTYQSIGEDISDRKRLESEKAKIEAQYRQAQKVESIGRLAGGVAHDLNNLLSPILGYGEMLRDDLGTDDARRDKVDEIVRAGFRARDLVHQLLAFSRKQALELKVVEFNKTVTGFEKLLRRTIREDIELELFLSPDPMTIKADVGQIEQVLMNLAVNASDAMPDGGKLTIETARVDLDEEYAAEHTAVAPGPYVLMAVSDTGSGMDDETRDNIFEPFFSTKGESGTGLGLATVYGIAKQHGGNIWVYSEPGKGTTFKIYLPVCEASGVQETTVKKEMTDLTGNETILLAEDNEQVCELAHAILERQGYTVLTAENGKEALAILESHDGPLHLLLTDVVMPEMNGRDLFASAAERHPGLKVLYMSGYTDNVIAHRGVLDEGVAFIQKPFTVQQLATKVREVLERVQT